jgi:hypothetical protein
MGCCQGNYESGEVIFSVFRDRSEHILADFTEAEFAEVSLRSSASQCEDTNLNVRFTEMTKGKELGFTLRSTNNSLHKTDLEQSFTKSKSFLL